MIKKIAILTSGGDAPGMNSAISALVDTAISKGLEPYLDYEGYKGLTQGNFKKVSKHDVKLISPLGGTSIYSARFPEFADVEVRKKALEKMHNEGIDALVVIGGDGSYMGASKLTEMGIKTIGLPGTIDNDISSTDLTIGFQTALNTLVEAIDKIRDTAESHERAIIVEAMGRYCGDLAINAAIATNAEVLSVPERKLEESEIISKIQEARDHKNRSIIIVVTEEMYDVNALAKKVQAETGIDTRANIIGHMQRGGSPIAQDRILASQMGAYAIERLMDGENGVAVNIVDNKLNTKNILDVVKMERASKDKLLNEYDLTK